MLSGCIYPRLYVCDVSFPDGHGGNKDGSAQCCTVTEPVPPSRPVPWVQSGSWFRSCWHEPARSTICCATSKNRVTVPYNLEREFAKRQTIKCVIQWYSSVSLVRCRRPAEWLWLRTNTALASKQHGRKWWILTNVDLSELTAGFWQIILLWCEMDHGWITVLCWLYLKILGLIIFAFWQSSLCHYFTFWVSKRRKSKRFGIKCCHSKCASGKTFPYN